MESVDDWENLGSVVSLGKVRRVFHAPPMLSLAVVCPGGVRYRTAGLALSWKLEECARWRDNVTEQRSVGLPPHHLIQSCGRIRLQFPTVRDDCRYGHRSPSSTENQTAFLRQETMFHWGSNQN